MKKNDSKAIIAFEDFIDSNQLVLAGHSAYARHRMTACCRQTYGHVVMTVERSVEKEHVRVKPANERLYLLGRHLYIFLWVWKASDPESGRRTRRIIEAHTFAKIFLRAALREAL